MEKQYQVLHKVAFASLTLSIICIILIAIFQPMGADDYDIQYSYHKSYSLKEHTLNWYQNWSGRAIGYAIGGLALTNDISRTFFQSLSALLFCGLGAISVKFTLGQDCKPNIFSFFILTIVLTLLWFCLPILGQTVFWTSGALVYLWPLFLLLTLIGFISFPCLEGQKDISKDLKYPILCFFLGFLVGNFQEQASISFLGFLIFAIVNPKIRNLVSFRYKLLPAALGWAFGAFILFFAEGNHIRQMGIEPLSLGGAFFRSFRFISKVFGQDTLLFIFIFVFLGASLKTQTQKVDRPNFAILWFILALISALPILFYPQFEQPRTAFYSSFFLLLFMTSSLASKKMELSALLGNTPLLALIATLPLTFSTFETAFSAYKLFLQEQERDQQIVAWKANPHSELTFKPRINLNSYKVFVWDLSTNPKSMYNKMYSEIKGIPSVKVDIKLIEDPDF